MRMYHDADWSIAQKRITKDCDKSNMQRKVGGDTGKSIAPLIDAYTDELRRGSMYKYNYPDIKEKNIMRHKEARDFRNAMSIYARNSWINPEINKMTRYQYSDMKVWIREDRNAMFHIDNSEAGGGPAQKDVRLRQTFDGKTGFIIEQSAIHPWDDQNLIKKRSPMGVTHIKTVFRYEDTKDRKKGKRKSINRSLHTKKNKKSNKGKKQGMRKNVKDMY